MLRCDIRRHRFRLEFLNSGYDLLMQSIDVGVHWQTAEL